MANLPASLREAALNGDFESLDPLAEADPDFFGPQLIGETEEGLNEVFQPYGFLVDIVELKLVKDGSIVEFPAYKYYQRKQTN